MGECCFVGFPKLLRHQSTLQSFKEGQLRFFTAFYRPTHTHTYWHTCPQTHTFLHKDAQKICTFSLILFPSVLNLHTYPHMEKCTHLKYSAADVPAAAVTPDPKLSVVVSLTVRNPIPARDREEQVLTLNSALCNLYYLSCKALFFKFLSQGT